MPDDIVQRLSRDIQYIEGAKACMNCGICTAICPAAEFYDYDPRSIITTVQTGDPKKIQDLLESDTIWYCGQCLSCKTRCPRENCPGLVITVLRKLSQLTGAFIKSKKGRQQYLIKKTVGENILKYGYCVHPTTIIPEKHPEQGPVWEWIYNNMHDVYDTVGANLDKDGPGPLRKISDKALSDLYKIFKQTGGLDLYEKIEEYSKKKALELGFIDDNNEADMKKYEEFVENEK